MVNPHGWPGRWPGVLVARRRENPTAWQGRVVFVVDVDEEPVVVDAWITATALEPAVD